jgi:hypothetical protein
MGQGIDYQKQMTEIVYVNLPGPSEPEAGMTGGELLHGFLAELYNPPTAEMKNWILNQCARWNVVYRNKKD